MSNQRRNERNVWPHLFEWLRQRNKFNLLNLNGANLQGANLKYASLEDANLWGADLRNANLEGCVMNWQSHDLIAERLRQWARADPERRLAAGYVLINRDWCWVELLKNTPPALNHVKQAALAEMATWVRDSDNAPSVLTRCMSEQQEKPHDKTDYE